MAVNPFDAFDNKQSDVNSAKPNPFDTFDAPNDVSNLKKFMVGLGSGLENAGLGIVQRYAEMNQRLGATPENIAELSGLPIPENEPMKVSILDRIKARIAENRAAISPLSEESKAKPWYQPTPFGTGEMLGSTVATLPIPGGAGKTALGIMGNAAVQGFVQPTIENESVGKNIAIGAASGGVLGSAMYGVGKAYNAIKNPMVNAMQTLADKYGIRATLGEITDNPLWKKTETWLENVPLIGLKSFREKQGNESQQAALNHFLQYVRNPNFNTTEEMKGANDIYLKGLYDSFRQQIQSVPPGEATTLKDATKTLIDRFPSIFEEIQDTHIKKILKGTYGDVKEQTINTGLVDSAGNAITRTEIPKISVDDLWMLRKGIGEEIGKARRSGNETAENILKKVFWATDSDMSSILSQSNNPAITAFREANDAFKQYDVKFDAMRKAYDKAIGTIGSGEMFSPKKFATELKNLAKNPDYKPNIKWSQSEIDQMTGLANIFETVKRSGQFQENPPTGNRWGPLIAGAELFSLKGLSAIGISRFLTSTELGKSLALSASKIESSSPAMQRIVNMIYTMAPRVMAQEGLNK